MPGRARLSLIITAVVLITLLYLTVASIKAGGLGKGPLGLLGRELQIIGIDPGGGNGGGDSDGTPGTGTGTPGGGNGTGTPGNGTETPGNGTNTPTAFPTLIKEGPGRGAGSAVPTATFAGIGTVTATASATKSPTPTGTPGLPDLQVDTSQLTMTVKNLNDNTSQTYQSSFDIGHEYFQPASNYSFIINKITIKNIGDAKAEGTAVPVEFQFSNDDSAIPFFIASVNISLEPGQSKTYSNFEGVLASSSEESLVDLFHNGKAEIVPGTQLKADLVTRVDLGNIQAIKQGQGHGVIKEKKEVDNNFDAVGGFFRFAGVRIKVYKKDGDGHYRGVGKHITVCLAVKEADKRPLSDYSCSISDESGRAYFLANSFKFMPYTYKISAQLVGDEKTLLDEIKIEENVFYTKEVSAEFLQISPYLMNEYPFDWHYPPYPGKAIDGEITIERTDGPTAGQQFQGDVVNGNAMFSVADNPGFGAGNYVIKVIVGLKIITAYGDNIAYNYPEPSRDQDPQPITFTYPVQSQVGEGSGDVNFDVWLAKQCATINRDQYCFYDDAEHIQSSIQTVLPDIKRIVNRLRSWAEFPLQPSDQFTFEFNVGEIGHALGSYFKPGLTQGPRITLANRYLLSRDSYSRSGVIYHEFFHALDNLLSSYPGHSTYLSTTYPEYKESLDAQLSSEVGRKLWDVTLWSGSYGADQGYTADDLLTLPPNLDKYEESFATSMSTVCVYQQQVVSRLISLQRIKDALIARFPNDPLPSDEDLNRERINELNRLQGTRSDGSIYSPQFEAWYRQCL